jgi:hypothetical protein
MIGKVLTGKIDVICRNMDELLRRINEVNLSNEGARAEYNEHLPLLREILCYGKRIDGKAQEVIFAEDNVKFGISMQGKKINLINEKLDERHWWEPGGEA